MAAIRPSSLRWRLVAAFGLTLAVILAAGRYVQYRIAVELLERDIDAQLWSRLGALRAERRLSSAAVSADRLKLSDDLLPDIRLASDRRPSLLLRLVMPAEAHQSLARPAFPWFASAWGSDGRLLAAADLPPDVVWNPAWRERGGRIWTDDGGRYRLAACTERDSLLLAGAPLDALRQARWEAAGFHIATLAVVTPLLVGLVAVLLNWLLRPLAGITSTVERIRSGRYHERIDLSLADAEIAGMAATINAMLDRLEEVRDKQARFNADLAHEVLGPVHGILLEADALGRPTAAEAPPSAAGQVHLEAIRGRAHRIETLCESLLSYSKTLAIAAGQLRAVDLEPVIDLAVEQVAPGAAARGVQIHNAIGSAVVRGQADLLQQVFTNLLANAVDHSPPGSEVRIEAEHGPQELRLRVVDHGDGVDAADAARVFERFFSRPGSGGEARESHGVGLSLSREIMRSHGGDLTTLPTPGGGATFVATFPAWTGGGGEVTSPGRGHAGRT